jgi:hypothetical protein
MQRLLFSLHLNIQQDNVDIGEIDDRHCLNGIILPDNVTSCREKLIYHRIISLTGEDWAHKAGLTPSLVIEVPVSILDGEQSYICVMDIDFSIRFWN